MSRIVDKPYFTYSAYNALTSGIQVKCPKCHGAGVVTADEDNAYFRCLSCGHQETPTGRSTAMMSITSAKTAADTIGWILKMRQSSSFPFSMWPVPIVEQPCQEKFIKQRRRFHILAKSGMGENLISGWNYGF